MRCWVWDGSLNPKGYGRAWVEGKLQYPHRIAYEAIIGHIPTGYDIDHLCRTHACYNPEHLEAVTRKENLRRGKGNQNVGKTHCPQGHPYSGDNLWVGKAGGYNNRRCLICKRADKRRYNERRKNK